MDSQHSTGSEETPIPDSLEHLLDQPIDVKIQLLQHHAEIARLLAGEIMDEEVESVAGERQSEDHPCGRHRF
jgi:hypothetical protein